MNIIKLFFITTTLNLLQNVEENKSYFLFDYWWENF